MNDFDFANKSSGDETYNLPKTIHFVWIGNQIPEKYIKNIQTFTMNEDYKVSVCQWTKKVEINL